MEKIIECVPNFSIGKNASAVEQIINSIKSVSADVRVLDHSYDVDHGRLVVTYIGDGDSLRDATYQGVKKAVEILNFNDHEGVHPCMGAVDVIPLIPLRKATFNDCVKIRNELSKKISEELGIPVFIYGSIAKRPERNELSSIRKGGIEGVSGRILTPEGKPDFGPSRLHPTAGAVAIGAREILIAFNINLDSKDLEAAKAIASKIRDKNSSLRGVKAIGVELASRGIVQVAVNIMHYKSASIKQIYDAVKKEAEKIDIRIKSSEIIGLIPKDAAFPDMKEYLNLENWDGSRILDNYL